MNRIRRSIRSISRRPTFVFGFLLTTLLGLSGNLYLHSLETSIRNSLQGKSRELLTADLSISLRRLTSSEEQEKISNFLKPIALEESRSLDLYSMLKTNLGNRLVEIIAIENNYPLVGYLTLERSGKVDRTSKKPSLGDGKIWIDPDVRDSLGIQIGGEAKIGSQKFTVSDIVVDDTANAWRSFSIAPRIVMSVDDLWKTGLIRKGSTVWDRRYSVLKTGVDSKEAARRWNALNEDPAFRATPSSEASEQIAKLTSRLNDYLGLIGVATLFLATIGIAFLFQTELRRRIRSIGVLRAFGFSMRRIVSEIVLEAFWVGGFSAVIAIALVVLTLPIAAHFVTKVSGVLILPQVALGSGLLTLVIGSMMGLFIAYPFAERIGRVPPRFLFQDDSVYEIPVRASDFLKFLPILILFYALSVYHAHSWRVGSLFFSLALVSTLLLFGIGRIFFRVLGRRIFSGLWLRIALRSLSRNSWSSLSGFVSIGLGVMLLSLIPDLRMIVESEIERPEGSSVPSLFLFDIQEEQRAGVEKIIQEGGGRFAFQSPLIRARLVSLRGKPVEKSLDFQERSTREKEEEERSRNRGFNLTYREKLFESEKIVKGRNFNSDYHSASGELPEVTLERQYADRLGIELGDQVGFSVEGVPIQANVVGLRRVRWSSFQPNFFVIFQPGVLEDAPKTFLGAVPKLPELERRKIQATLVERFPNVSVLNVDEIVRKVLIMFEQMSFAITVTAILSLLTGMIVIFLIARRQILLRRRSAMLLRTVGAGSADLYGIFLIEFAIISVSASIAGMTFSMGTVRILAWVLFDRLETTFHWSSLGVGVGAIAIVLLEVFLVARKVVHEKPWAILQAEGDL